MKILNFHEIFILVEEPQKSDNEKVGLPSYDETCASAVLTKENRPGSLRPLISHIAENIQNDCDEMIVDSGKSVLIILHPPFNP